MKSIRASYILTKAEIAYVINCFPAAMPAPPLRYVLDNFFREDAGTAIGAAEGLLAKKLVRTAEGGLVLEPAAALLARAALAATALWLAKGAAGGVAWLVLQGEEFYLLCQPYPHIAGAWRITPCQNRADVREECGAVDFGAAAVMEGA